METIHGNMHVLVLTCKFLTCINTKTFVSMYFLHLVPTFTRKTACVEVKGFLYKVWSS